MACLAQLETPRSGSVELLATDVQRLINELHRSEATRVLATLIRLIGNIELAEDAVQEAFAAALQKWPAEGVPTNPRAWLISTGRFKAIDAIRRREKLTEVLPSLAPEEDSWSDEEIQDDVLRLIFICCHPALPEDGRVALTLREVCGLTTDEIAKSFLSSPSTVAQRIVRAKSRIRTEQIPYELPESDELAARLASVLRVAYLVFNEGYYASSGYSLLRPSLSQEAIRLGRLLEELLPDAEVLGLLALMLFQESRRLTRMDAAGDVILLADQDRTKWNRNMILEAAGISNRAGTSGPYALQAAIARVHALSASSDDTDWALIVSLYDQLLAVAGSPVVELNRAVAIAMRDGPELGVALIDGLFVRGQLLEYGLAHSARADLLTRLGRTQDAEISYRKALSLASLEPERRFLERRLKELAGKS